MKNCDVRAEAMLHNVKLQDLARAMGVARTKLSVMLTVEWSDSAKKDAYDLIHKISTGKSG